MRSKLKKIFSGLIEKFLKVEMTLNVQFDITNSCNLKCLHCYHSHHNNFGSLTFDQWIKILNQYQELQKSLGMLPNIVICGGEPLLCPFLMRFIKKIREIYPTCSLKVLTNGVLITNDIAKFFYDHNVCVQISFEGPRSNEHDLIRGKGNFDLAIQGVEKLKNSGVNFYFQTVLSQKTQDWIEDFFILAKRLGASGMNFTRLIIEGSAKIMVENEIDAPLIGFKLKNAMESILHFSTVTNVATSTAGPLWCLIDKKLGSMSDVGINSFVIDYQGYFKPASRLPLRFGNVLKEGLSTIFYNNNTMKKLRDGEIEICKSCVYQNQCRGNRCASYVKFGHLFGIDPGCWLYES